MKKLIITILLSGLFLFFPFKVCAYASPRLINNSTYNFFIKDIGNIELLEKDISKYILDNNDTYNVGEVHSFSTSQRSVIAFDFSESEESLLGNSSLKIESPTSKLITIPIQPIMLVEIFEIGEYKTSVISSNWLQDYKIKIAFLNSPFVGENTFIGPNVDLNYYSSNFEEYIQDGGTAIVYRNDQIYEKYNIHSKKIPLIVNHEPENRTELILDQYFEKESRVYTLESEMSSVGRLEVYRNVSLALNITEGKGRIVVLNPIITIPKSSEVELLLNRLDITEDSSSDMVSIKRIFIIGGILLSLILFYQYNHIFQEKFCERVKGKLIKIIKYLYSFLPGTHFLSSFYDEKNRLFLFLYLIILVLFLLQEVLFDNRIYSLVGFVGLLFSSFFAIKNRIWFKKMSINKKIIKIYLGALLFIPVLISIEVVGAYLGPFLSSGMSFDINVGKELGIHEVNRNLFYDYNKYSLYVRHLPSFQTSEAILKINQDLKTEETIYLGISDDKINNEKKYLFFDKDLSKFPSKFSMDDIWIYAKGNIETHRKDLVDILDSNLKNNALVGSDTECLTSDLLNIEKGSFLKTPPHKQARGEKNKLDIDTKIKGSVTFYTIVNDTLHLRIRYTDENAQVGRDDFIVKVKDYKGKIIATKYVSDDDLPLLEANQDGKVEIKKGKMRPGIYRIEIVPFSTDGKDEFLSRDIELTGIYINSSKLVFDSSYEENILLGRGTRLNFFPLESHISITPFMTNSAMDNATYLQYFSDQPDMSMIDFDKGPYSIQVSKIKTLKLPFEWQRIKSFYNFYSFTPESYFYPFRYYFSEIDSKDSLVLSKSDLLVSKSNSKYKTEIVIDDINYSYYIGKNYYFNSLYSMFPNRKYIIDRLTLNFKDS